MGRETPGPSGMRPPAAAVTPHGQTIDLLAVARRTCEAYDAEYPDERERYGRAGMEWCVHDNQHLVNWAVLSLTSGVDFEEQLAWLESVLEARAFPLDRLAWCLGELARSIEHEYPGEAEIAQRLREGSRFVAARSTFL